MILPNNDNRKRRLSPVKLMCRLVWQSIKVYAIGALIVAGICAMIWCDYTIFRVNHPEAPWWGFLLH